MGRHIAIAHEGINITRKRALAHVSCTLPVVYPGFNSGL